MTSTAIQFYYQQFAPTLSIVGGYTLCQTIPAFRKVLEALANLSLRGQMVFGAAIPFVMIGIGATLQETEKRLPETARQFFQDRREDISTLAQRAYEATQLLGLSQVAANILAPRIMARMQHN